MVVMAIILYGPYHITWDWAQYMYKPVKTQPGEGCMVVGSMKVVPLSSLSLK